MSGTDCNRPHCFQPFGYWTGGVLIYADIARFRPSPSGACGHDPRCAVAPATTSLFLCGPIARAVAELNGTLPSSARVLFTLPGDCISGSRGADSPPPET